MSCSRAATMPLVQAAMVLPLTGVCDCIVQIYYVSCRCCFILFPCVPIVFTFWFILELVPKRSLWQCLHLGSKVYSNMVCICILKFHLKDVGSGSQAGSRAQTREPTREPGPKPGANPGAGPKPGSQPGSRAKPGSQPGSRTKPWSQPAGPKPGSQPGSRAQTREPTWEPGPNPGANPPLKFCVAYVAVATASRGLSSNVHCKTHRNCNSTQLQIHCHCHTDLNVTVPQATRASSLFTLIWGLQGSRSRVCNIDYLS